MAGPRKSRDLSLKWYRNGQRRCTYAQSLSRIVMLTLEERNNRKDEGMSSSATLSRWKRRGKNRPDGGCEENRRYRITVLRRLSVRDLRKFAQTKIYSDGPGRARFFRKMEYCCVASNTTYHWINFFPIAASTKNVFAPFVAAFNENLINSLMPSTCKFRLSPVPLGKNAKFFNICDLLGHKCSINQHLYKSRANNFNSRVCDQLFSIYVRVNKRVFWKLKIMPMLRIHVQF